ncbi:hypothetical protein ACFRMO_08245 [Streptomyces anulatus]|uniref:hypothetical protein n=1 Tax=Streptomyces anulatus TaxID=1892 RepID=UPI0036B13EA2
MSETATTQAVEGEDPTEDQFISYRVTWQQPGADTSHTTRCLINAADMSRPGDPAQRNELLRKMIAIRHLPHGLAEADNIALLDVIPLCNCMTYPNEPCQFAEYGNTRFRLLPSTPANFEAIHDRHDDQIMGRVRNTLSVEFLTMVREKYSHQ